MQQRKVYVDDWCLMEKICLVSAVLRLGDSNWSSICDLIKPKLQENRPWDWFTPNACEAQYKVLFNECVKTQTNDESPALQIIKNLKTKCKIECQRKDEQRDKYMTVRKKIENFLKNGIENELIDKYYEDIQREKKEKDENLLRHQEALKRRETLKTEFEKANVPRTPNKQETKADGGSSPIVTSPLLSSLLNNPPAVQYRPTLSTSSFIPTKTAQSSSKSSSFDKFQSFSSETTYKDSFSAELAEQVSALDRQAVSTASSCSTPIKKSGSQELIKTTAVITGNRNPVNDSSVSRIQPSATETASKADSQSLENLGLISPNEEYLAEVDIPSEELLEVIADPVSLDKLIRDLQATDEGVINDKDLTASSITVGVSYTMDNKPIEQAPFIPEPSPLVQSIDETKTKIMDESKIDVNEVEVQPSDSSSTEHDKLGMEEQVIIVEDTDREEREIHVSETDIANIEVNNEDVGVTSEESPSSSSFSSTVAVSVECESSFSEHKSDYENIELQIAKPVTNENIKSEVEDLNSNCTSKPVVVIKRIEDPTNHSNKNKKHRNKIPSEDNVREVEGVSSDFDQIQNDIEISPETAVELPLQEHVVEENQQTPPEHDSKMPIRDENIVIQKDIDSNGGEKLQNQMESTELVEPFSTADDSDVSDKFEDALQTQLEDSNEVFVTENTADIEAEIKSSPCADTDKSLEFNASKDQFEKALENAATDEKHQIDRTQSEIPVEEQILNATAAGEAEIVKTNEPELVESKPCIEPSEGQDAMFNDIKTTEAVEPIKEIVEESEKSEDVKPPPTKIIKSSKRKRKSISETSENPAEMSIIIPNIAVKNIEPIDLDVEQKLTSLHAIKTEPSDTKLEDERKEQKEETLIIEKPILRESTPARIKSEKRDTKTPEPVVMVLRRSNSKTQSPLKKIDRESRTMDNTELIKTRKKSIMLAYTRLTTHKYANAFQKPITNKQVPGYESIIYKPMDLHTIKKKIDNKQISSVAEFQRDILLMLNNAKMFNRINSQVYNMAVEVEEDALPNIQLTVQNLGEGVLNKIQKNSEKIRKRQSMENTKKDLKLIKRIKYSTKDDSFTNLPIKKPKLEENEDE